ncbi:MAG TPA: hypothetical protein VHA12_01415 [Candidatus Nanoarchaeia archaeon]|nr:hypothetical protein [Candidatus Nanoarchaeia archaeon]
MSFKEFARELNKDGPEGEVVKTVFVSLISSFMLFALFYYVKFRYISDFIPKYGFFVFLSILSYAIILPTARYISTYKEFPCMSGMMIGMTIGMVSGFLPGFVIGATNGMFYGSVFGMAVGILFGAWNGKCCGIMGVMEGVMAGFMGGLMGAMSSVMMLNDHLKIISIIVFIISTVILFGLTYMIYKEVKQMQKSPEQRDVFFTIFWSILLTLITLLVIVFGPRSFIFQ